jgi:CBS domain containing-hemolysin-like protein
MAEFWLVSLKLLAIAALILANGFFVAAEFSLVSVRSTRIDQLAEEGSKIARVIQRAKADPNRFLITSQIGITLASLALGWIAEPTLATLLLDLLHGLHASLGDVVVHGIATVITFTLITYMHIVIGENIPKAFALQRTEPTIFLTAMPLEWLSVLFTPFIAVLGRTGQVMLRWVGITGDQAHHLVYTEDELRRLLAASHEEGLLEAEERAMLEKVFDFSDLVARDVMVPRPDIRMVPLDIGWPELLAYIERFGHSRYPVFDRDSDHVVGFVHLKDIFGFMTRHNPEAFELKDVMREVFFVPETKLIVQLLEEFKRGRHQLAIVMDEYGGTVGMITPQDLVEEIVGAVEDEFGPPKADIVTLGPGRYRLNGRLRLAEFNERFGTELPTDEFDTIAGWIFGTLGREAHEDDEVEVDTLSFTVEQLDGHRIISLLLERTITEEAPAAEPSDA